MKANHLFTKDHTLVLIKYYFMVNFDPFQLQDDAAFEEPGDDGDLTFEDDSDSDMFASTPQKESILFRYERNKTFLL